MTAVSQEYSKYQRTSLTYPLALYALGEDYIGQTSSATYSQVCEKFKQLNLPKNAFILDAGCGNGCFAYRLIRDFACQVLGVDISDEAIKAANENVGSLNGKGEFKVADFTILNDINDAVFDAILSIGSLYWNENLDQTLQVWNHKLVPGGKLLLYANMQCEELTLEETKMVGNTKFVKFEEFKKSLQKTGYKVDQVCDETAIYFEWIKRWCKALKLYKKKMEDKMGEDKFDPFAARFRVYKNLAETQKVKRYVIIATKMRGTSK